MSLQIHKSDQPLKSILKQTRQTTSDDNQAQNLEREVKFWKTRFDDLMQKRQKQLQSIYRQSIWDLQQDEQKDLQLFTLLEQKISDEQNSQNIHSQKQISICEFNEDEKSEYGSKEHKYKEQESCEPNQIRKQKSLQDKGQNSLEQIEALTLEKNEWKLKYEESIHPRNIKKIQDTILKDFLCKAQLGIQEAHQQFEEEKRTYINQKDQESNKLQQKIIEYASMMSEKDALLLQKELIIGDLELNARIKDEEILKMKDEIQKYVDIITNKERDLENFEKLKLQWSDLERLLREEISQISIQKEDCDKIKQSQFKEICDLQKKLDVFKEQSDEQKMKISKLKIEKEEQEEMNEQIEEYRNKICQLEDDNNHLKNDQINLQFKLKNSENFIQQKGVEVQQLIFNLQEEMKNYAREVELAQESELKYENRIQELETLLIREKQLTLILQDTILNKSLAPQYKQQQVQLPNPIEKVLFKDNVNLRYGSSSNCQRDENTDPEKSSSNCYLALNNNES